MTAWHMSEYRLKHPTHGAFYVSYLGDSWTASRVYGDPEARQCETIGTSFRDHRAAIRACDKRIDALNSEEG